jgi:hypothetical protein
MSLEQQVKNRCKLIGSQAAVRGESGAAAPSSRTWIKCGAPLLKKVTALPIKRLFWIIIYKVRTIRPSYGFRAFNMVGAESHRIIEPQRAACFFAGRWPNHSIVGTAESYRQRFEAPWHRQRGRGATRLRSCRIGVAD